MGGSVTSKGQVTIPKRVRDELGIRPGARVHFESDGCGGARLFKEEAPQAEAGFARFLGIAPDPDGLTTDEYMALIRDPIDA